MAKEMIDRNLFVQSINESIAAAHKWGASAQDDEIKIRAEQAIATFWEASLRARQMPTIDAVEVVRCKDCKYNYANMIPSHSAECSLCVELPITDEFFCAKGEREESGNENK